MNGRVKMSSQKLQEMYANQLWSQHLMLSLLFVIQKYSKAADVNLKECSMDEKSALDFAFFSSWKY